MKTLFKLTLLLLLSLNVKAQQIDFAKNMDEAIKLSAKKKKFLFVLIETQNTMLDRMKGLSDPEVVELINKNFIPVRISYFDAEAQALRKKYTNLDKYPAFLFLRSDQDMFFNDYGISATKQKYLKMVNDALEASKQKTVAAREQDYVSNKKDIHALKAYIDARKKQGIKDNAELIEQYVNLLTIADFNNYQTVLYILEAGPYLDGNAYKFSRTNFKIVDSIYKTEPLERRQAINAGIKTNTLNVAIQTKNVQKAQLAANFVRNAWGKNYAQGMQSYEYEMLFFYRSIKDTAQYFRSAKNYFDRYYMAISADSIKKLEDKSKTDMLERAKRAMPNTKNTMTKEQIDSLSKLPNTKIVRRVETFSTVSSPGINYANQLNNAAYSFYETGTKNLDHLSKALIWSKRAITLNPQANNYDTLAHIYYAMGIYNEALSTQKLAIEKAKEENQSDAVSRFQKELDKMINKTL